ncbi:hypothetical protein CsatA_024625 [Cannabis sativa]
MKSFPSSMLLLVLLLLALSSIVKAKHQVSLVNFIDLNTTLTLHCQSKDDDLGMHELFFGESFKWSFRINFMRTTLFFCDMSWVYDKEKMVMMRGHFDVFVTKRDAFRCLDNKCYWEVLKSGLYLYIWQDNDYELQYIWPNTTHS